MITTEDLKNELKEIEKNYDVEDTPISDEPLVPTSADILKRWLDLQNQIEQMRIEEINEYLTINK